MTASRIVVTYGVVGQGTETIGAVLEAGVVVLERKSTRGGVVGAGRVDIERIKAGGGVVIGVVVGERIGAVGRVVVAGGVKFERFNPGGRVVAAGGVVLERISTEGRVTEVVAYLWTLRISELQKSKGGAKDYDKTQSNFHLNFSFVWMVLTVGDRSERRGEAPRRKSVSASSRSLVRI